MRKKHDKMSFYPRVLFALMRKRIQPVRYGRVRSAVIQLPRFAPSRACAARGLRQFRSEIFVRVSGGLDRVVVTSGPNSVIKTATQIGPVPRGGPCQCKEQGPVG